MKIYTSYFANYMNLPDWWVPVSIARFPPRYFRGKRFHILAPDKHTIKYDWENFKDAYNEKLATLDPVVVLHELEKLSAGKDVIILGYGKDPNNDTRGIIAHWFKQTMGIEIIELEDDDPNIGTGIQMIMEF